MRILHLSWEYPPTIIGGLGRHVHDLAGAQAALGHEVVVLAASSTAIAGVAPPLDPPPASIPAPGEVLVVRVDPGPPRLRFTTENLLAWVAGLELALVREVARLGHRWRPDVLHGHDWMVARAGVAAREIVDAPLVATIHATEAGRSQGWISSPLNVAIHTVEWWLANSADRLIACSEHMRTEVASLFHVAPTTIDVIANGIDLRAWVRPDLPAREIRAARIPAGGPLVVYTGRVEWEKGVQTLLAATPRLVAAHPGLQVVVTGRGTHLPVLQAQAARLGLGHCVTFTGWMAEQEMHALVAAADLAVVPSLYEPFGLVALEAAALGTPLIVSRTGGLAEFARDGLCAGTFTPGNPESLADAAEIALGDPGLRAARVAQATQALLTRHQWATLAGQTLATYDLARHGMSVPPRVARIPDLHGPLGNLLTGEPP